MINSSGNYVFYLTNQTDATYYSNQVIAYAFPTSLPSGWTTPGNFQGFPASVTTPQLVILTNNFGSLIGYTNASYPSTPQTTNQSFSFNTTPNATPVNSLLMRCNLTNNNVVMPSDILGSVSINNTTFGSNLNYIPTFSQYIAVKSGRYTSMTIQLLDQNYYAVASLNPNIRISLLLKFPNSLNLSTK